MRSQGKVYLIGAGPGDPKLITLRAVEAIQDSHVIVYDYLVNPEILAHSRRNTELIYVGKRGGHKSISQSEINRLLIERAQKGQVVSRLKGGDPFIIGRGGEEAEALNDACIHWEVIPGVSSGVAAAAYAGIPLTHRQHSSSVAFITGHDAYDSDKKSVDWKIAAHSADTLVIFMCAERIAEIVRKLVESGRSRSTPIALIRWGTYEHQEVYSGTLADLIEGDVDSPFKIDPPTVAIVGEVAAFAQRLSWFGSEELRFSLSERVSDELQFVGNR